MKTTFTITELSSLTKKTRPTIYKYIDSYEKGYLNNIPYNFVNLFDLMNKEETTRQQVIEFCDKNFNEVESDESLNSLIKFLKEYRNQLNFNQIKEDLEKLIAKEE